MSHTATISTLYAIQKTSRELKLKLGGLTNTRPLPPPSTSFPYLLLPYPVDILRQIDELPLPHAILQQIKMKMDRAISSLRATFIHKYHDTCHHLAYIPDGPSSWASVKKAYESLYRKTQLPHLQSLADLLRKMIESQRLASRRVTFNTESTPLLESYFEQNAYPSGTGRIMLACKTGMTTRQIEVWFQNHRNRAKKAGRPLARLTSEQLVDRTERTATPEMDQQRSIIPPNSGPTFSTRPFNSSPPPTTAFPSPFDHGCEPKPMVFPKAVWPRTPASSSPARSSTSMKELCTLFSSKLRFPVDSGKPKKRTTGASQEPWFSSRVTRIPKQHPAFLPLTAVATTRHKASVTPPALKFSDRSALQPIHQPAPPTVTNEASFAKYSKSSLGAPTPSLESVSFDSPSPSSSDECPPTPPDGQDLLSLGYQDSFSADDLTAFLDNWVQQASLITPDSFLGADFVRDQDITNGNLFLPSDYSFVPTEPFIPQAPFDPTFNPYLPLSSYTAPKSSSDSSSLLQQSHPALPPSNNSSYLPQPPLSDVPHSNEFPYLTQPSQPALPLSNDFSYLPQPFDSALQPPPNPFSNDFDFYSSFSLLGSSFDFPSNEILDIQLALPDASHLGFI